MNLITFGRAIGTKTLATLVLFDALADYAVHNTLQLLWQI
jgi:hypothetical protein